MQNLLNYSDSMLVKPNYLSIVSVKISNGKDTDINNDGDGDTGADGGGDGGDGDADSDSHSDSVSRGTAKSLKIDLLHCIDTYNLENFAINSIPAIVPVNGKLVVFAVLNSKQISTASEEDENSEPIAGTSSAGTPPTKIITALNEFLYPVHFNLMVFDGIKNSSRLLYSGEIVTDAGDDNNAYKYTYKDFYTNDVEDKSSFMYSDYNYYEHRNIGLVTVEGVNNND